METRDYHLQEAETYLNRARESMKVAGNASHAAACAQIAQAHAALAAAVEVPVRYVTKAWDPAAQQWRERSEFYSRATLEEAPDEAG